MDLFFIIILAMLTVFCIAFGFFFRYPAAARYLSDMRPRDALKYNIAALNRLRSYTLFAFAVASLFSLLGEIFTKPILTNISTVLYFFIFFAHHLYKLFASNLRK